MIEREYCFYVEIKLLEIFLGYFYFFVFVGVLFFFFCFCCFIDGVWVVSGVLMIFIVGSNIISFVCKYSQLLKIQVMVISLFEMDVGLFIFQLYVMSNRLMFYY